MNVMSAMQSYDGFRFILGTTVTLKGSLTEYQKPTVTQTSFHPNKHTNL